jgi:hypothetical protein
LKAWRRRSRTGAPRGGRHERAVRPSVPHAGCFDLPTGGPQDDRGVVGGCRGGDRSQTHTGACCLRRRSVGLWAHVLLGRSGVPRPDEWNLRMSAGAGLVRGRLLPQQGRLLRVHLWTLRRLLPQGHHAVRKGLLPSRCRLPQRLNRNVWLPAQHHPLRRRTIGVVLPRRSAMPDRPQHLPERRQPQPLPDLTAPFSGWIGP